MDKGINSVKFTHEAKATGDLTFALVCLPNSSYAMERVENARRKKVKCKRCTQTCQLIRREKERERERERAKALADTRGEKCLVLILPAVQGTLQLH